MKIVNLLYKLAVVFYILGLVFKVMQWPFGNFLLASSPLFLCFFGLLSFMGAQEFGRSLAIRRVIFGVLAMVGTFRLLMWPSFYIFDLLMVLGAFVFVYLRFKKKTFNQQDIRLTFIAVMVGFAVHVPQHQYFNLYAGKYLTQAVDDWNVEIKLEYALLLNLGGEKTAAMDSLSAISTHYPDSIQKFYFNELQYQENYHALAEKYLKALENNEQVYYNWPMDRRAFED